MNNLYYIANKSETLPLSEFPGAYAHLQHPFRKNTTTLVLIVYTQAVTP